MHKGGFKLEFPLYPTLSEDGKREAQELVEQFKKQLAKAAEEAIFDLYTNIVVYIESDSWTNFRNKLMDGFKDYNNRKIQGDYDFREIRKQIYKDYKDEIIKDLDQDNLKIIESLQTEIKRLENALVYRRSEY